MAKINCKLTQKEEKDSKLNDGTQKKTKKTATTTQKQRKVLNVPFYFT